MGPAGDQADVVVQSFGSGVVHSELDGRQDPLAVLADGLGDPDERGQARAGALGAPPVEQRARVVAVQVAGEDGAEGLLSVNRLSWLDTPPGLLVHPSSR